MRLNSPLLDAARPRSRSSIDALSAAGEAADTVLGLLAEQSGARGGMLASLLPERAPASHWQHYGEVEHGARWSYYFHAHRNPGDRGEYGHFHLFSWRPDGSHAHVLALGVDAHGLPLRGFCSNAWVTAEQWLDLPAWRRETAGFRRWASQSAAPIERWLGALLSLFAESIDALLQQRQQRAEALLKQRPGLLHDRRTTHLASVRLDLASRLRELDQAAASTQPAIWEQAA